MIGLSKTAMIGAAGAAIAIAIITALFLMLQAAEARAAQMEERAAVLDVQRTAERMMRLQAQERAQEFQQVLNEREKRLQRARENTEDLRQDLQAVREQADEEFQRCMDVRVPGGYIQRMRDHLRSGTATEP